MRERPAELPDAEVIAALAAGWGVAVRRLRYEPVGAGSYHWSAPGLFVTVDDLGSVPGSFARLAVALETACRLREAGLTFVVAPLRTSDGAATIRLTSRYALSVFPALDGVAGSFGPHHRSDLPSVVGLLVTLHGSTALVADRAQRADLDLPGREGLERALASACDDPAAERAEHRVGAGGESVEATSTKRAAHPGAAAAHSEATTKPGTRLGMCRSTRSDLPPRVAGLAT